MVSTHEDPVPGLTADEVSRLREVLIVQACIKAIHRYSIGVDLADLDMLREAFHDDAVLQMGPTWVMTGHDEITQIANIGVRWADKHHFSMDHLVVVDGPDHAHGIYHGLVLYVTPDLVHISGTARYRDRFERRNGVWRIAHRNVEIRYFSVHPTAEVTLNPPELSNEWLERIREKERKRREALRDSGTGNSPP